MTREEARLMTDYDDGTIDKIYDDFESRLCENCKYWNKFGRCISSHVVTYLNGEQPFTFELFGCNQFERKTHE